MLRFLRSLFGVGRNKSASAPNSSPPPEEVMRGLREIILRTPASELGIEPSESFPRVFGMVMDMPISGGLTASVVSNCTGDASLYTTSTFGVIGGIGHESVRNAAGAFVQAAQPYYDQASPTAEFPYPATGRVRFYLLGFDGVRVLETDAASLQSRTAKYFELWMAGQNVLTELRLVSERTGSQR